MKTAIVFLVLLVLYVHAGVFDCDENHKCRPGLKCEDGQCVTRLDCPQRGIPEVKPGCRLETVVDSRDCPKTVVVCDKQ
ncbi:hypothetical protein ANCCEY_15126 [Ancylostoma ceylanicum]|uniref:Uncharacterized protein n=1 Tax=Ancylostoma ceylanicum TaxID=53326 RepID=A0A0D6L884_9BILA|nr:hypothetical protein ANCCEY_15126 [Ancylostoma ceylanicum]